MSLLVWLTNNGQCDVESITITKLPLAVSTKQVDVIMYYGLYRIVTEIMPFPCSKILTMASSNNLCCLFLLSVLLHISLGAGDDPTMDVSKCMVLHVHVHAFLSAFLSADIIQPLLVYTHYKVGFETRVCLDSGRCACECAYVCKVLRKLIIACLHF